MSLEQKEGGAEGSQSYCVVNMTNSPVESCAEAVASQNLLCEGTRRPLKDSKRRTRDIVKGGLAFGQAYHCFKKNIKKTMLNSCSSMEHWC